MPIAKCGEKPKKIRPRPQDVAPAGGFFCVEIGMKKVERPFYFPENGRKTEDTGEKGWFPVGKKTLLFGFHFRILGNIGGEKWE